MSEINESEIERDGSDKEESESDIDGFGINREWCEVGGVVFKVSVPSKVFRVLFDTVIVTSTPPSTSASLARCFPSDFFTITDTILVPGTKKTIVKFIVAAIILSQYIRYFLRRAFHNRKNQ